MLIGVASFPPGWPAGVQASGWVENDAGKAVGQRCASRLTRSAPIIMTVT
jgi:predicted DNA-binding transcriptional regulator AlpA